jgi:hypothetical protein
MGADCRPDPPKMQGYPRAQVLGRPHGLRVFGMWTVFF